MRVLGKRYPRKYKKLYSRIIPRSALPRIPRPELKQFINVYTVTPALDGAAVNLYDMAVGTQNNARIGNQIHVSRLVVRCKFTSPSSVSAIAGTSETFRAALIKIKGQPVVTSQSAFSNYYFFRSSTPNSIAPPFLHRSSLLRDKVWTWSAGQTSLTTDPIVTVLSLEEKEFVLSVKFPGSSQNVTFNSNTAGDLRDNGCFLWVAEDSPTTTGSQLIVTSCVYFTDA